MIVYDPHNWSRQIFALNGTVLRRVLGRVALVALITLILSLLKLVSESEVLDFDREHAKLLSEIVENKFTVSTHFQVLLPPIN